MSNNSSFISSVFIFTHEINHVLARATYLINLLIYNFMILYIQKIMIKITNNDIIRKVHVSGQEAVINR